MFKIKSKIFSLKLITIDLVFSIKCSTAGDQIFFTIGGKEYACPINGGGISIGGYAGTIDCPPVNEFCPRAFAGDCPLSCSTKGYCVKGICQCSSGYSEADCGTVHYNIFKALI